MSELRLEDCKLTIVEWEYLAEAAADLEGQVAALNKAWSDLDEIDIGIHSHHRDRVSQERYRRRRALHVEPALTEAKRDVDATLKELKTVLELLKARYH